MLPGLALGLQSSRLSFQSAGIAGVSWQLKALDGRQAEVRRPVVRAGKWRLKALCMEACSRDVRATVLWPGGQSLPRLFNGPS